MSKRHDVYGRITFSYNELASVFQHLVRAQGSKLIVYEHEADESVSRTHCHFISIGGDVSVDTIKNHVRRAIGGSTDYKIDKGDWAFRDYDHNREQQCIAYMTKGVLEPNFMKGWEPEFILQCKSQGFDRKQIQTAKEPSKQSDWYFVEKALRILYKRYYPDKTIPSMLTEGDVWQVRFTIQEAMESIRAMIWQEKKVIGKKKFMDYLFYMMVGVNSGYQNEICWMNIENEFNRTNAYF